MNQESFESTDGVEVHYRSWPVASARGSVVIAHGASEHSGRYGRFAGALNDAGLAAFALDHRGHGATALSTGPGRLGDAGMQGVLDDLAHLVSIAAQRTGAPVVLFGHSMGSLFVQALVERGDCDLAGYVLSGSMGPLAEGMDEVVTALGAAVDAGMGDETLDVLGSFNDAFEPARTPYDWLSRDVAEVDAYVDDPLCGDGIPLTHAYAAGMMAMIQDAMSGEGVARTPAGTPVMLVTGTEDPVSGNSSQVRLLEESLRSAGAEVTARYYAGARHELLNETNRDEVTADIVDWVTTCLSPS